MKIVCVLCLTGVFLDVASARYLNTELLHRNRRATLSLKNRYRPSTDQSHFSSASAGPPHGDLYIYPRRAAPTSLHRGQLSSASTYRSDPVFDRQQPVGAYQRGSLSSQSRYSATPLHSSEPSSSPDLSYDQPRQRLSSMSSVQNRYRSRVSGSQVLTPKTSQPDPPYLDSPITSDLSSLSSLTNLYRSRLTGSNGPSAIVQPGKVSNVLDNRHVYQKAANAVQEIYRSGARVKQDSISNGKIYASPSNPDSHHLADPAYTGTPSIPDPTYPNSQSTGGATYLNSQSPVDPSYPDANPIDTIYSAGVAPSHPNGQPSTDPAYTDVGGTGGTGPSSPINSEPGYGTYPGPRSSLEQQPPPHDNIKLSSPPYTGSGDPHVNNPALGPDLGPLDPHFHDPQPTLPAPGPLDQHFLEHQPTIPAPGPLDRHFNDPQPTLSAPGPLDQHFNDPQPTLPAPRPLDQHFHDPQPTLPAPGPLDPHFHEPQPTPPSMGPLDSHFDNPILASPLPTPQAFVEIGGPTVEGPIAADPALTPTLPLDPALPAEPVPVEMLPDVRSPITLPLRNPIVESESPVNLPMFRDQPNSWVWGDRVTGQLLNFNPNGTPL